MTFLKRFHRRDLFRVSAAAAAGAAVAESGSAQRPEPQTPDIEIPKAIRDLRPMTAGITPISDDERRARIARAQELIRENRMDGIVIEPGTTLLYYTGVRWGLSERLFAFIIPANGQPAWICPGFEENRAREVTRFSNDVRVWQEHENPCQFIVQFLKERGSRFNRIGVEQYARFFILDNLRKASPATEYPIADPVTVGCRMIKSAHEIALMQRANEITLAAFKAAYPFAKEGMTPRDFGALIRAAHTALGAPGGSGGPSFGKATSNPHGSIAPQVLKEGDVILVDGGCDIEGYKSDITRSWVYGKPSEKQIRIWNLERKAQDAALAAARPGVPCEAVDYAARKVLTDAGLGPDYKLPGLPHRTGHGIGMDGHEAINLVRGNKIPMRPGMCFSDEPMIVVPDEFGIRLEDCMHITENGAKLFTTQAPSIEHPFG
jgi:Xaa-Pro dipeptidase